ncbi:MAG: glycerophosphodiester phosphodiesterase family protein [Actinomycetota bacterium]
MRVKLLFTMALAAALLSGCARKKSPAAGGVQDYMPDNAVIAHRGTIYWAPELTEAAFRWARNTGADYMELDLHRSKDSVIIIMHDKTFKRTTDVAEKFPGREADPISSFTLEEIMQLDNGSAFNKKNPEQALQSFIGQDVLVFEDVFRIGEGKRIKRNADGSRMYTRDETGVYHFEYEDDPADNGHRPGIYIEFKIPDEYPLIEEQVYDELTRIGWNPLEGEIPPVDEPFLRDGKVNVGKTRGKILVQTFSKPGMMNLKRVFREQVPASYLIGNPKTNEFAKEEVTDGIVAFARECGAQFIGTNLGDENDGLAPAFAEKIHAAGLKANIYSINTVEQMEKYFGQGEGKKASPLADGMITNRTDLTIDFYHARKVRANGTEKSPQEILADLGYNQ